MTHMDQLREDLAYVRAAADKSEGVPCRSIYLLWAAIVLCGFTLVDFATNPRWINLYWLIASPAGFAISLWIGVRAGLNAGQADRRQGIRIMSHWLAFMVAGLLGVLLAAGGHLNGQGIGSLWVLLLALTYFLAGLHFDRRLLPVGILVGLCYPVTIFVAGYGWTVSGIVVAAALTLQAFLGSRTQDASI